MVHKSKFSIKNLDRCYARTVFNYAGSMFFYNDISCKWEIGDLRKFIQKNDFEFNMAKISHNCVKSLISTGGTGADAKNGFHN